MAGTESFSNFHKALMRTRRSTSATSVAAVSCGNYMASNVAAPGFENLGP